MTIPVVTSQSLFNKDESHKSLTQRFNVRCNSNRPEPWTGFRCAKPPDPPTQKKSQDWRVHNRGIGWKAQGMATPRGDSLPLPRIQQIPAKCLADHSNSSSSFSTTVEQQQHKPTGDTPLERPIVQPALWPNPSVWKKKQKIRSFATKLAHHHHHRRCQQLTPKHPFSRPRKHHHSLSLPQGSVSEFYSRQHSPHWSIPVLSFH